MSSAGSSSLSKLGGSSRRLAHLDALRALAVMIVVLDHAGLTGVVPGVTGVTIFFTISGFIITTLLLKEWERTGSFNIRAFYIRRAFKILPPLFVAVVLPSVIAARFIHLSITAVLAQVFFVFNWWYVNGTPRVLPGSRVVWSLAIEEQFYIVFALMWLVAVTRWRPRLPAAAILTSVVVAVPLGLRVIYFSQGASATRLIYGSDTRLDSIGIGVAAAFVCRWLTRPQNSRSSAYRLARTPIWLPLAVVLFAMSVVIRADAYKGTLRMTAESFGTAILILYPIVCADTRTARLINATSRIWLVQMVGLASYSIYLLHNELIAAMSHLSLGSQAIRIPLFTIVGTLGGVVMWVGVERPALRIRDHLLNRAAARSAAASGPAPLIEPFATRGQA